jgi:hypothetical protein
MVERIKDNQFVLGQAVRRMGANTFMLSTV